MNRGKAYEILAARLDGFRLASYSELLAKLGAATTDTVPIDGQPTLIECTIEWADQKHEKIRITAGAYGPSTWRLERLVESIEIAPD